MPEISPTELVEFALSKWKDTPHFQIEDAYKWLYQATRGGEHAAPDAATSRKRLTEEWANIDASPTDIRLWEPLWPDGRIGRLHLQPFKQRSGNIEELLTAFLMSSDAFGGDADSFLAAWNELGESLKAGTQSGLTVADWTRSDDAMRAEGFPPISHSRLYSSKYKPAYRLLNREEMSVLLSQP